MFKTGKGSFGHTQFKSIKYTPTLQFPFFFFTTTVFNNRSRNNTFLIASACFNFSTSSFPASTCCLVDLLSYFLGGTRGSTFNLWVMKVKPTPGTSYGFHAKTSKFCTKDSNTATHSISILIWEDSNLDQLFCTINPCSLPRFL